jgi:hypothetical protein
MIFTPAQIEEILELIEYQYTLFGARFLGTDPLAPDDKLLLKKYGIDISKIKGTNYVETAYKFGMLSRALNKNDLKAMQYNDFKKWIQRGGYIPLSQGEKATVEYLKRKSFSHLKNLGSKIQADTQQMLLQQDDKVRQKNEKLVKKELKEGILKRNANREIVSNLGHKTGDWLRDWDRIVETEMHTAMEEGRADDIKRNSTEEDPLVYKQVQPTACRHCIRLFLTDGLGSKPKIFKLSELRANGTNIGLKVNDWKPVLSTIHPFCRCFLQELQKGYVWDQDKGMFVPGKVEQKVERKSKIYITIGDKQYVV